MILYFLQTNLTEIRYQLQFDVSLDNVLVVDGVPVIEKTKLEKLLTKVCKEFSRKGVSVKPDDIFMPWDDSTGKSKGWVQKLENYTSFMTPYFNSFMFIESKSVDDANLALSTVHNHPFDAKHTFKINRFNDIERYASMDEIYLEPEIEEYTPRVRYYDMYIICHLLMFLPRNTYEHGSLILKLAINM